MKDSQKVVFALPTRKFYKDPWLKIGHRLKTTSEQIERVAQPKLELTHALAFLCQCYLENIVTKGVLHCTAQLETTNN